MDDIDNYSLYQGKNNLSPNKEQNNPLFISNFQNSFY